MIVYWLLTQDRCHVADSKVHSVKLQAEFEAPLWHVMSLMVEFDLTKTWNAFMQVLPSLCCHLTPLVLCMLIAADSAYTTDHRISVPRQGPNPSFHQ